MFKVERISDAIVNVQFNRPEKRNSVTPEGFLELGRIFQSISTDEAYAAVRCAILSAPSSGKAGATPIYCAGIDLMALQSITKEAQKSKDVGRRGFHIRRAVERMQAALNSLAECRVPVIAAIDGLCIGAGLDIVSACDIRFASPNAVFSIKEVDMGLAADLGTLQRVPLQTGNDSLLREVAFTSRNFSAAEALQLGLLWKVVENPLKEAIAVAEEIAKKPPLAVAMTKDSLNEAKRAAIARGLQHIATVNGFGLQSTDIALAVQASMMKQPATYAKL
jgi:enoyl-CoA hydratase/carnithine racemase